MIQGVTSEDFLRDLLNYRERNGRLIGSLTTSTILLHFQNLSSRVEEIEDTALLWSTNYFKVLHFLYHRCFFVHQPKSASSCGRRAICVT